MQLETALRLPAVAMQLSNVVKTFVLRATNVPKRTANTMAMASAKTPHTIPAVACPGFVAPFARPRVTAMPPRTAATRPPSRPRGNKMKDTAATRLATPRTRAATPRPFPGRADGGAASGCADPGSCGVLTMPTFRPQAEAHGAACPAAGRHRDAFGCPLLFLSCRCGAVTGWP